MSRFYIFISKTFPTLLAYIPKNAIELSAMSDIVIEYEKEHYPIGKPVAELIALSLEEQGITQRQLAQTIGVSPSSINDYVSGRSEPTLKKCRMIVKRLEYPHMLCLQFSKFLPITTDRSFYTLLPRIPQSRRNTIYR